MTLTRIPASLRVLALALIGYALSSQVWARPASLAPHYVYLAHALLHGHVDLIQLPPTPYDLVQFSEQWFVAGSPMPAVLMLPFAALFGVAFSDVLFSVVLGAINVALVYDLLSSIGKWPGVRRSESARRWITLLFAFGTPHWYLAALGTYWFTAHIVAVFFILLATRESLTKQRWFLAGLWLACAAFARPTTLALSPFFLIIMRYAASRSPNRPPAMFRRQDADDPSPAPPPVRMQFRTKGGWEGGLPAILRHLLAFALALLIGLGAHGWYNLVRFGKATDFGYSYVVGAPNITSVYARYSGFNPRFLPCNLAISLLSPPEINGFVPGFITQSCSYLLEGVNPSDTSAPITPNPFGMSVFTVTPALLLIFATFKRAPLIVAAWIGLLSTLLPLWLYHNTGSLQFGYRYVFDAAPMWIILLACAIPKITRLNRGLILVSIAMNAWGMLWMFEKLVGRSWF